MATFEKNSWSWQVQQWQQNLGEWWEWQQSQWFHHLPSLNLPTPDWPEEWGTLLVHALFGLLVALLALSLWWNRRFWLRRWQQLQAVNFTLPELTPALTAAHWLKQAQQLQQSGNYYQACRCLYLAMLQHLHDQALILHAPDRTDEEYLLLVSTLPDPEPYETLLEIHQQLCFGQREASAHLYARCDQAYRHLAP
ncbi:DUF4129 domain-containing protein [Synechocystis sp. LKSZ1]|uniref:DUF4129 domain-containing protein n=1 Tax=Synechocystis sp. LKSZ1 TaxID=3144951 RepID=UPI00336BB463